MATEGLQQIIDERIAAVERRVDSLSKKQREILVFIITRQNETGIFPTIREIAKHVGVKSTNTVSYHLARMEKPGEFEREFQRARSYNIPELVRQINEVAHV